MVMATATATMTTKDYCDIFCQYLFGLSVKFEKTEMKSPVHSQTPINKECTLTLKSLIQFERILLALLAAGDPKRSPFIQVHVCIRRFVRLKLVIFFSDTNSRHSVFHRPTTGAATIKTNQPFHFPRCDGIANHFSDCRCAIRGEIILSGREIRVPPFPSPLSENGTITIMG